TAGQCFENNVAKGVGMRREDEEVHVGVGLGQRGTTENTGEVSMSECGAERGFFCTVAYDEEAEVGDAESDKLAFDAGEQSDILFDGQATDEAEDEGVVVDWTGAVRRGELFRVNAALHQVAGPARRALEHGTELFVWRIEHASERVEV